MGSTTQATRPLPALRITCPDCAATYDVPASHARAGRQVRCVACATQWLAFDEPDAGAAAPVPLLEADPVATADADALSGSRSIAASLKQHSLPAPEPPVAAAQEAEEAGEAGEAGEADAELPDLAAPGHHDPVAAFPAGPPAPAAAWRAAWAASVLLLVAIGTGCVHWRQPIMLGWPPSTRLYAVFGTAHMPRAATAESVAPKAASAISNSPSTIRPPGVSE